MKIERIVLENYRCYKYLEVDLHPKTTVLVANNGQGKTSILDAIRIALWPFVSQFDLANSAYKDPSNTITIDDVRIVKATDIRKRTGVGYLDEMVRVLNSSVTATGDYGDGVKTWKRFRDSEAVKSQIKDDVRCRDLKAFAKKLQNSIRELDGEIETLPMFGYYGTGRLWKEKRLTQSKRGSQENDENIRTFALRDCLDPASSYRQFEDWFTNAYKKVLENQIEQLQQGATFIEVDPVLKVPVKVVQDAVDEVLKPVGWKNLQYSHRDGQSLVLSHDDHGVMKADRLSDGIKNILAMIADIAYRCVLLNAHLGEQAAKETPGVVMIDEIDMHLHPQWQQTVIGSLQKAFPAIQFILTTHSPQVLSTVPKDSIRVIGKNSQGEDTASLPLAASYGEPSNDVLQAIMHVDPQPPVPEKEQLEELTSLVDQGDFKSDRAKTLLVELKQALSEGHPQILRIERSIRRQVALSR